VATWIFWLSPFVAALCFQYFRAVRTHKPTPKKERFKHQLRTFCAIFAVIALLCLLFVGTGHIATNLLILSSVLVLLDLKAQPDYRDWVIRRGDNSLLFRLGIKTLRVIVYAPLALVIGVLVFGFFLMINEEPPSNPNSTDPSEYYPEQHGPWREWYDGFYF